MRRQPGCHCGWRAGSSGPGKTIIPVAIKAGMALTVVGALIVLVAISFSFKAGGPRVRAASAGR